jgi:hypothetical protein
MFPYIILLKNALHTNWFVDKVFDKLPITKNSPQIYGCCAQKLSFGVLAKNL